MTLHFRPTDLESLPQVDANEVDDSLKHLIRDFRFALSRQSRVDPELKDLVSFLLSSYWFTHLSMQVLFSFAAEANPLLAPDGISLCREQVEKLYTIALIVDRPKKWIRQYRRSHWLHQYGTFLREKDEHQNDAEMIEFLRQKESFVEEWRRRQIAPGRYETLVSKKWMKAIKFNYKHRFDPKPWPKDFSYTKRSAYFDFPMPGEALAREGRGSTSPFRLRDGKMRHFLWKWHIEYQVLSKYSHVALDKLGFVVLSRRRDMQAGEQMEMLRSRLSDRATFVSYAAAASAMTIASSLLLTDYGVRNALRQFWEDLIEAYPAAQNLWDVFIEEALS